MLETVVSRKTMAFDKVKLATIHQELFITYEQQKPQIGTQDGPRPFGKQDLYGDSNSVHDLSREFVRKIKWKPNQTTATAKQW